MTELYARSWALDDIEIVRAKDGGSDGRTVRAYAAVFDTPAEIRDQHGHYLERIDRNAFQRSLGHGISKVKVFYNHGMTLHGTPSGDASSVPIGTPLEIRPDGKGLLTVTRYNDSPFTDTVLEAIRAGQITGYSFRGRIFRSSPERMPRVTRGGSLPTIVRTELGLTEYGPTPNPAYDDASVLAIRAALLNYGMTPEEALRMLASTTPRDSEGPETLSATSSPEPGDNTDPPAQRGEHSRVPQLKLSLAARLRDRGL